MGHALAERSEARFRQRMLDGLVHVLERMTRRSRSATPPKAPRAPHLRLVDRED